MSRKDIVDLALTQLGKPYFEKPEELRGVKLEDASPAGFDCSFFVEWCYWHGSKLIIPRNSNDQFEYCKFTDNPLPGDLGFFADKDNRVYHVGIVVDNGKVIEARFPQPNTSFETGKVIFRPLIVWASYINPKNGNHFKGWRAHPNLIGFL